MSTVLNLVRDMTACSQTTGMSVYQHGQSVHSYYKDLINHLTTGDPLKFEWVVPDWVYTHRTFLITNQYCGKTMKFYQILHDCGKPACHVVDGEGRSHFPDHANISSEVYGRLTNSDPTVQSLIAQDMRVHTMKAADVLEFCGQDARTICSLLLTSLAEVHSNASMFGGVQSTSFKIKNKQITKRGRACLKILCP